MSNSQSSPPPSSSSHGPAPPYSERASSSRPSRHHRAHSRSTTSPSPTTQYVTGALPPFPLASTSAPLTPAVPMPPQPTYTQAPHAQEPIRVQYDEISAMFGGGRRASLSVSPTTGRPSQSSSRSSGSRSRTEVHIPPPYDAGADLESLPSYTKEEEYSAELNRKLFIYGFIFFPLWVVGIIAPFVKPHRDPAKDNRSKEDQEADYASMRAIEMRWAWRCGFALLTFVACVIVAVIVGITVAKHH